MTYTISMPLSVKLISFFLMVLSTIIPYTQSEPDIIPTNTKIVEGTDRVHGSGIDHSLPYMTPSSFYGPEALYLLHGTCFTQSIDR